jgi:iron-sulfur cluster repair protein YtfE (RIC family)
MSNGSREIAEILIEMIELMREGVDKRVVFRQDPGYMIDDWIERLHELARDDLQELHDKVYRLETALNDISENTNEYSTYISIKEALYPDSESLPIPDRFVTNKSEDVD